MTGSCRQPYGQAHPTNDLAEYGCKKPMSDGLAPSCGVFSTEVELTPVLLLVSITGCLVFYEHTYRLLRDNMKQLSILLLSVLMVPHQAISLTNFEMEQLIKESREKKKKSEAAHSEAMASWLGANINRLISKWGPPTSEYVMPNGDIMYTWRETRTIYIGFEPIEKDCVSTFTATPSGKVFDWRWRGNDC